MTSPRTFSQLLLGAALLGLGSLPSAHSQNLRFGGFVSAGYLESSRYNYLADTEGGTFDFAEIGLNASWTPASRLTVNGQLFAFELGPYGNFEPLIDYLFVDYSHCKEFGIRAGRIKRELGIYTQIQDIDVSRSAIILPHGIYDPRYREFSAALDGLSLYGTIDLPAEQRLSYNAYAGRIKLDPDGGLAGFSLTEISRITVDNELLSSTAKRNYGGQLWYHPKIDGLRFGLGHSHYPSVMIRTRGVFPSFLPNPNIAGKELITESEDMTFDISQASAEYYVGNWNFAAEYQSAKVAFKLRQSIGGNAIVEAPVKADYAIWYLSAARRFGSIEIGYTHTHMPPDSGILENDSANYQYDHQLSLRYDLNDHWTFKIERHAIEGTKRLFNQYGQNPILDERCWTLWAAKSTFSF